MELGTISLLVQLLLIFVLVAVVAGLRRLRIRREQHGTTPHTTLSPAAPWPAARTTAPILAELPAAVRLAPLQAVPNTVSEELLPGCFADTCADWTSLVAPPARPTDTRFSLADWSAATDHVALDTAADPATLDWALEARVDLPRAPRPATARAGGVPMSCTIAPQEHQCA